MWNRGGRLTAEEDGMEFRRATASLRKALCWRSDAKRPGALALALSHAYRNAIEAAREMR